MKRLLLATTFVTLSLNAFASDYKQTAYNQCLTMKKGSFSERTSEAICNCFAEKVISFIRRLTDEEMGKDDDGTVSGKDYQVSEKYSNEFFRVCLFSVAPRNELEANGIRAGR
jgi:hypothetical protein